MKRLLIIVSGYILLQFSASFVAADELTPIFDPKGYRQTLPGMLPPAQVTAVGTLKGNIQTADGKPMSGGKLYIYNAANGPPPETGKYLRVPDVTSSLEADGGFSVELPQGGYYIGAMQRISGDKSMPGSPTDGDIYYDGKILYEVLPASIVDANVIRGGKQFATDMLPLGETPTAIEGEVLDVSGKPVVNAVVFAYTKADMNERPIFVSAQTGKNGVYRLSVAGDGTFFLRVSAVYRGGMPDARVAMGAYGGIHPKAVIVKKGEIVKGIHITDVKLVSPR